jgi:hypothetical protein
MIALTLYLLFTAIGLALGFEVAHRRNDTEWVGTGAAIYSLVALLVAFFFGGWAATRLAVGESKLEAILHGMILWGLLFLGMFTLIGSGVRAGFGGIVGVATGVYSDGSGQVNVDEITADLKEAGIPADQVDKVRSYYDDPSRIEVDRTQVAQVGRQAANWTLVGILVSMAAVITGALVGSGELPVAVPLLGVRRQTPVAPRI